MLGAKNLSCPTGSAARRSDDWHDPFGGRWERADAELLSAAGCCRKSCHGVMAAKNISCDVGTQSRHAITALMAR